MDIFSQASRFAGAFKANAARMNFSTNSNGDGGLGLLVQNIAARYNQQVSRIWELGSSDPQNTYFVVGRSQGDLGIGRVIGPQALSTDWVAKFSNPCNTASNVIRIDPTPGFCGTGGSINKQSASNPRTFNNCIITNIALSMNAQDMMIQEQVGIMFTELDATGKGA